MNLQLLASNGHSDFYFDLKGASHRHCWINILWYFVNFAFWKPEKTMGTYRMDDYLSPVKYQKKGLTMKISWGRVVIISKLAYRLLIKGE